MLNDMHPIKSLLEQQKIGHGECLYTNENRSREIDAFFPPFFSLDGGFVLVRLDISLVNERKDRTSSYTSGKEGKDSISVFRTREGERNLS